MTDNVEHSPSKKAVNLVILYELDMAGRLQGMTLQEIADMLNLGHRSSALRAMRSLAEVKEQLPQVRARLFPGQRCGRKITAHCPACGRGYRRPAKQPKGAG